MEQNPHVTLANNPNVRSVGVDRKQQHTTQIHVACYKVVGLNSAAVKFLFECLCLFVNCSFDAGILLSAHYQRDFNIGVSGGRNQL